MKLTLPNDKHTKVQYCAERILRTSSITIRKLAQFVGTLVSACPAVKYGWLYTKNLEREKWQALQKSQLNYRKKMQLGPGGREDLRWWITNASVTKNLQSLILQNPVLEIYTDACTTGWGAVCEGRRALGWWTSVEKQLHINQLELMGAFYGVKCFAKNLKACNILIRIDNTTAQYYINKMGSIRFPALSATARNLWQWCEERDIYIQASHISSLANFQADQASRALPHDTEWELCPKAYQKIIDQLGKPGIDLFATYQNTKCSKFISWTFDPESIVIDAFTVSWTDKQFYAFPAFALIHRTINKIVQDQAEGILVVPYWRSQPWFPLFVKLRTKKLLIFEPRNELLLSPSRTPHPLAHQLTLVATTLSGKHSSEKA